MDRRELFDRLRQSVMARTDLLRYGRGRDVVSGPPVERGAPEGRFFFASDEIASLCAGLRQVFPSQAAEIIRQAETICHHRFDLLGYQNLDYGVEIDWQTDVVHGKRAPRKPWFKINYLDFDEVGDSKITWELNRHQHFVTLAKAYWLSGDDRFVKEIFAQWAHWHRHNPYPNSINWASNLEVAFRSLSWIWTYFLVKDSPLFSAELRGHWQDALSLNGRYIETYLSTYFSPNTHLLGEALALFFLGTLFPNLRSAAQWKRRGWEILGREAGKQVRQDGFYFEQSTYYHVYALDMFLHARTLAALNEVTISREFDQILQRMLNALLLLGRAGLAPRVGDDDGGRLFDPQRNRAEDLLDPLAAGAILLQRGDFKFAAGGPREETLWLLGMKGLEEFDALPGVEPSAASTALQNSGIYLMADETSGQQLLIFADAPAGPPRPAKAGHSHADALSVCLVRNGRELLLDPGTFEYVGDSGERVRLRGTGAHNTMQVDGRDQAEGTGPFSWESSPHVKVEHWITGKTFNLFQGSHDGYSRLPSPVIHRRWVFHRKEKFWLVRDLAKGSGSHELEIAWHIGSTMAPAPSSEYLFTGQQESLALLTAKPHGWSQSVTRDSWSPAYGRSERASVVTFGAEVELPADFATLLIAKEDPDADLGRLVKMSESIPGAVCAYRYSNSHSQPLSRQHSQKRQEHCFFFANQYGTWASGAWASDAEFLYCSFDREEAEYTLVLCNGSFADAGGRRVLSCERRVSYAEVVSSAQKVELFSSDPERVVLQQPLDQVWAEVDLILRDNGPHRMGV
jgi:hypothetical protein